MKPLPGAWTDVAGPRSSGAEPRLQEYKSAVSDLGEDLTSQGGSPGLGLHLASSYLNRKAPTTALSPRMSVKLLGLRGRQAGDLTLCPLAAVTPKTCF